MLRAVVGTRERGRTSGEAPVMLSLVNSSRVGGCTSDLLAAVPAAMRYLRTYKEIQQREFSNEPEGYKSHERDAVGRGGQGTRAGASVV